MGRAVGCRLEMAGRVQGLLLQGADTAPWFRASVRDVAQKLHDATVVTVPGAGRLGPRLASEPVAEALIPFFTGVPWRARRRTGVIGDK